jgi:hypothetical protein
MTTQARLDPVRELIGDHRLKAFFQAACKTVYPPRAIKSVCECLDQDQDLDSIFKDFEHRPENIELSVIDLGNRVFEITFGFRGSHLGDGGTWKVEFNKEGEVIDLEQPGFWIEKS